MRLVRPSMLKWETKIDGSFFWMLFSAILSPPWQRTLRKGRGPRAPDAIQRYRVAQKKNPSLSDGFFFWATLYMRITYYNRS